MKELIQELEEKLLKQDIRKSAKDLDGLLADEFVEVGSTGAAYGKDEIIAGLLNEDKAIVWELKDFAVRILSSEIVLATYIAKKTKNLGAEAAFSSRSSLWQLKDNGWQMVFHQGTPVLD